MCNPIDPIDKLSNFLDSEKKLVSFPAKRKMKLYALLYLSTKFNQNTIYTEIELNDILNQWHTFGDPATLRRELYNLRFINRDPSGKFYWLEPQQPTLEELEIK